MASGRHRSPGMPSVRVSGLVILLVLLVIGLAVSSWALWAR